MQQRLTLVLLIILTGQVIAEQVSKTERIVWTKKAIYLHLKVGKERNIIFPSKKITVSIDRRIDPLLKVTPLDGTLYLKPMKAFKRTRIRVIGQETGQTYLLDLEASERGSFNVVEILLPKRTVIKKPKVSEQPDLVELSRYASQQIFSPRRIIKKDDRFNEVQLSKGKTKRLYRGGDVVIEPYRSWRAGDLYVTAVRVFNNSVYPIDLDFRMIRGQTAWKSAVFQHARITQKGSRADSTFMYLVSARPFHEVNYEEAIH